MYGLGRMSKRGGDPRERVPQRREEIEAMASAAREKYPELQRSEAIQSYQEYREARQEATELQREFWPILGAIGLGVVFFTVLKKK